MGCGGGIRSGKKRFERFGVDQAPLRNENRGIERPAAALRCTGRRGEKEKGGGNRREGRKGNLEARE